MKIRLTIVSVLAVGAVFAGCGGDSSSTDTSEDDAAITSLVAEINRVSKDQDAQGFCALMQPSGVKSTFDTYAKCVKETGQILKQSGEAPTDLKVEDISIDGNRATVNLSGETTGAPVQLVKEDGKWYVPLSTTDTGLDVDSGTTDG
ncbi:MAG: hypothetical protein WBW62_11120 [Solirubrobacterales bacterium]